MNELVEIQQNKSQDIIIRFRNKSLSENSKKSYSDGVKSYYRYLEKTGETECVESIQNWLNELISTVKPSTYALRSQALKDYLLKKYEHNLQWCFGIQELFKTVKRVKVEKAIYDNEFLTIEQVDDVANKVTKRLSLIIFALFWTGCRVTELINIKLADVKLNGIANARVLGKGGKERTVYLPLSLYEEIKQVFKGKTYLFETRTGRSLTRMDVHKELRRQSLKRGYDIHPHTLRHSKAMFLKDVKKLSADQIAKALGHADVATTLRFYFHGTPSAESQGILEFS